MSDNLFRKASLDGISSPDQLNEYIKVSTPGVWIVLSALLILAGSVIFWSIAGNLPSTISMPCVALDGRILCYTRPEDALQIKAGQSAWISGADSAEVRGEVVSVGSIPLSEAEIAAELKSDYLVQAVAQGGFSVQVVIAPAGDPVPGPDLLAAKIVTGAVRPVDFLIR